MALTAGRVVVLGWGRLLRDQSMADVVVEASTNVVSVRSPRAGQLRDLIAGPDVIVASLAPDLLQAEGLDAEQIGATAARAGLTLLALTPQEASLEDAYLALTENTIHYRSHDTGTRAPEPVGGAA